MDQAMSIASEATALLSVIALSVATVLQPRVLHRPVVPMPRVCRRSPRA